MSATIKTGSSLSDSSLVLLLAHPHSHYSNGDHRAVTNQPRRHRVCAGKNLRGNDLTLPHLALVDNGDDELLPTNREDTRPSDYEGPSNHEMTVRVASKYNVFCPGGHTVKPSRSGGGAFQEGCEADAGAGRGDCASSSSCYCSSSCCRCCRRVAAPQPTQGGNSFDYDMYAMCLLSSSNA